MTEVGGEFDQAFAALIGDLDSRGLLKARSSSSPPEFGRTADFSGNGRGHYPKAFSTVLAGAGVKRGYVHGAHRRPRRRADDKDMVRRQLPRHHRLAAGCPSKKKSWRPNGRPFTIGNKAAPASDVFA